MSKTVLSEMNGFTPVPDVLVKRYGHMTALVFGMVWRYCQMKDRVCRASLERMACELEISRMSVLRHIRILVEDGFLKDTTPGLRNRPHIYADTGKVAMLSRLEMAGGDVSEGDSALAESYSAIAESDGTITESNSTITESNGTITLCDSHSTTESLEDSNRIAVKKPLKITTTTGTGAIFKIYEQEIGPLTSIISQEIGDYLDDPKCPAGYIAEAIQEAARQNKRNWSYVRAILKRWMVEGKQARVKSPPIQKVPEPDHPEYKPYVDPFEGQYVPGKRKPRGVVCPK